MTMDKSSNRALRRHHLRRLRNRRKHYRWVRIHENGLLTGRELGIVTRTPKICSCTICGNPRRHFGDVTLQERKAACRSLEDGSPECGSP